ncbi:MAG: glutathione S-transferase family protein [Proteobacteria bacterium]|nr:glutathione S-transferase family protein [Pseudomonadota bacterium]
MILLHQFPPVYGLPSLSPFCVKVETYLKLAGLPHKIVVEINPRRGPKGKMPFIEDGEQMIADSSLIVSHLKKSYGDPLDRVLTANQHAVGTSVQRMCEDHLYWVLLYARWGDESGFSSTKVNFAQMFPFGVGPFIMYFLRQRLIKQGFSQGMLRHHADEIYQFGREDLAAIAQLLNEGTPFLFGSRPTSYDASVYAFLATICSEPTATPLKVAAMSHPVIGEYIERIKNLLENRDSHVRF